MASNVPRLAGSLVMLLTMPVLVVGSAETLNDKVLAYARKQKGKQVGDGECTTLAFMALRHAGSRRTGRGGPGGFVWGRLLGKNETIYPGDIIQFDKARFEHHTRSGDSYEEYPQHTAIIDKVDGQKLALLHQNVNGRKIVALTTLNLAERTKGTVKIYRPLPPAGHR